MLSIFVREITNKLKLEIMKTTKFNFAKNFTANAEIADLEKLGWAFSHDETANAMDVSFEEAEKHNKENYHIEITVDEDGKTFWRFQNTEKYSNGINEGSDNEETGDDDQTIKDLEKLHKEGKLWNEKNID